MIIARYELATPDACYGQERETNQPATLQPPSRLTGHAGRAKKNQERRGHSNLHSKSLLAGRSSCWGIGELQHNNNGNATSLGGIATHTYYYLIPLISECDAAILIRTDRPYTRRLQTTGLHDGYVSDIDDGWSMLILGVRANEFSSPLHITKQGHD